ncbi:MAG: DJ-1/PfpI family protein [Mycoplasma sp.]
MLRIAIIVANKSEDMEVIVPLDLWRRAGFFVKLISVEKKKNLILARGTKISCDEILMKENLTKYNAIFLPGGEGHMKFNDVDAPRLINFLKRHGNEKKINFLSICAATQVYGGLGMLDNVKATCYPGCQSSFKKTYVKKDVVVDKNFITANGPAAAVEFALTVIKQLEGDKLANEVASKILYKGKI